MSEHVRFSSDTTESGAGRDAGDLSRAEFLKRGVLAGGALTVAGALATGGPGLAAGSQPSAAMDTEILNYFLMLEYLQEAFYDRAVAQGALSGELQDFAETVREHEREHISFLEQILGPDARDEPSFDFGSDTDTPEAFRKAAVIVEETTASAYIGQGANLTKANVLGAARIVSVEARHAAWIKDIIGRLPAPRPADVAKSEAEVRRTLRRKGWLG